ncbi:hypothetical protein CASFOL_030975 [Castilleja foliolosa]|uniref:Dirigent protein n=1 Tax=Castilleja foliolosa TaxID=1961234 RepID=A0ABD3C6V9_9LAMI
MSKQISLSTMASIAIFTTLLLIISSISIPFIHSHQFSTQLTQKHMARKTLKTTRIRFFFHDIVSGRNPTAIPIVPAKDNSTFFGSLTMIDDPLTVGPSLSSKIIGRAQGFYGGSGLVNPALLMVMNYVFTNESKHYGSTLSLLGRNPFITSEKEMPIVGGTGKFRFAQGFVRFKTYSINSTGDAIVQYNATVYHF